MLAWIESYLGAHHDKNPRLSAQWLISDVLHCNRLDLYLDMDRPFQPDELSKLHEFVARRAQGEPLQYIVGATTFRKISVRVEKGVLIPRPETEVLVSDALDVCTPQKALDLCTGTGCIACSIAQEVPGCHVVATDIDKKAVSLATRNRDALGLGDAIDVYCGDLGDAVPSDDMGTFDLIISNPPYVPSNVVSKLDPEVSDFEPSLALDGGKDGLDLFRRIVPFALAAMNDHGVLACELYESSLDEAKKIAEDAGFPSVSVMNDLTGRPRVLIARKSVSHSDDGASKNGADDISESNTDNSNDLSGTNSKDQESQDADAFSSDDVDYA